MNKQGALALRGITLRGQEQQACRLVYIEETGSIRLHTAVGVVTGSEGLSYDQLIDMTDVPRVS